MLTARQNAILRAAVDRIIPADDFAGGWDAGVGDYLRRQLRGDLRSLVAIYRAGLDALDAAAQAEAGAGFVALPPAARDALLARIESGVASAPELVDLAAFFRLLIEHAMEGYYSDPGNGGNRAGVAWRMIGFEVRG